MAGRWDHNDRAYNHRNAYLWEAARELRSLARRQARLLRDAQAWPPTMCQGAAAWRVGHHAGRLLALRMEAYDRQPDLWERKCLMRERRARVRPCVP